MLVVLLSREHDLQAWLHAQGSQFSLLPPWVRWIWLLLSSWHRRLVHQHVSDLSSPWSPSSRPYSFLFHLGAFIFHVFLCLYWKGVVSVCTHSAILTWKVWVTFIMKKKMHSKINIMHKRAGSIGMWYIPVIKHAGSGVRQLWVWILALPLAASGAISGKLPNLCVPLPSLHNRHVSWVIIMTDEIMHRKPQHSAWYMENFSTSQVFTNWNRHQPQAEEIKLAFLLLVETLENNRNVR